MKYGCHYHTTCIGRRYVLMERFLPMYVMTAFLLASLILVTSCVAPAEKPALAPPTDTLATDTLRKPQTPASVIETGNVTPAQILQFAQTLIGIPYKYASTDPAAGFDCSGFITYVFNHFNINVPRSSVDFTNVEHEVPIDSAKPGDLILFTGTDSTTRMVGHMGIIMTNADSTRFIHSSSGKANGVTITALNSYYKGRFVKVIRIFPEQQFR